MKVHRLAAGVLVQAPAKVNLFFEALAKRSDGFHEVETLMVPISLYDTLFAFVGNTSRVRVDCRWVPGIPGTNAALGELPTERDNLATKAVELLRGRTGIEKGIEIDLVKRIPSAAGFGGASSDAAAALLAANALWNLGWSREALADIGAELGSDVPFFLGATAAICRGRGERIEPVTGTGAVHLVVVRPPEGLSTARVYANCRVADRPRSVTPLVEALRRGDTRNMAGLMHNRLEVAAESLSRWIPRLRAELAAQDCLAAQMSGSGTGYLGICRHARHARRVARRLRSRDIGHVYAVSTSN
jgi:4-diphosphocytidyl-2-C-methyl-D-erythritol kinase